MLGSALSYRILLFTWALKLMRLSLHSNFFIYIMGCSMSVKVPLLDKLSDTASKSSALATVSEIFHQGNGFEPRTASTGL